MTSRQRATFERLLHGLEDRLTGKIRRIEPNRTSEAEVGTDEDEQPLNEMLQAIASNRNRNTDGVLRQIRAALQKLESSPEDFGQCEDCGEEIGLGRLKAMPYAVLCVQCQGKRDAPKGGPTRRRLTDYVE